MYRRPTVLATLALTALTCTTGVEPSPRPGILLVTLRSNPADTLIIIANDTVAVGDGDWFGVRIFQGQVFSDTNYAFLFGDTSSFRLADQDVNLIEIDSVTGQYKQFVLYLSHVPPGDYDRIQFGMTPYSAQVGNLYIPVDIPPGTSPLVELHYDFAVFENGVTEVNVQINPFESVVRYRDSFHFTPVVEIVGVTYH